MKKVIIISLTILGQITSSCQNVKKDDTIKQEDTIKTETTTQKDNVIEKGDSNLKDDLIKLVVNHYELEINKDKIEGQEVSIDNQKDGTTISVTYPESVTGDTYEINKDKIVIGDLNKDNFADAVISVGLSFGPSGYTESIFLFTKNGNQFNLFKVYDYTDLSNCDNTNNEYGLKDGGFTPTEIKNNILIGKSLCYDTEDAKCCPSKEYELQYEFNTDLRLIKKTKK